MYQSYYRKIGRFLSFRVALASPLYACISLSTNIINLPTLAAKVTAKNFVQFRSLQTQPNLPKTSPVWVTPPPAFRISAFSVILWYLFMIALSLRLCELCARPERTWKSNNIHLVTKLAGWGGRRGEHAVGRGKELPTCYHRVGQYIMGTTGSDRGFFLPILFIISLTDGFIIISSEGFISANIALTK